LAPRKRLSEDVQGGRGDIPPVLKPVLARNFPHRKWTSGAAKWVDATHVYSTWDPPPRPESAPVTAEVGGLNEFRRGLKGLRRGLIGLRRGLNGLIRGLNGLRRGLNGEV